MRLIREVEEIERNMEYRQDIRNTNYLLNCHIGHRKLLNVLLEFITESEKRGIDFRDSTVLYIGASPGISINVINELYPETKWILYDKNESLVNNKNNNIKFIKKYYDDDEIENVIKIIRENKKKYFLYISDMRDDVDEKIILEDMKKQQKWIYDYEKNKIRVDGICLKMRLPYYNKDKERDYNYQNLFNKDKIIAKKNNIIYLDGKIRIQAYAPKRSTETRLISYYPYKAIEYDIREYENKMNYFNIEMRSESYEYKNSNKNSNIIFKNYDEVREYQIISDFCEIKKIKVDEFYRMMYKILNKFKIVGNITCKLYTFDKNMEYIKSLKTDKNNKEEIMKDIIKKMNMIIEKINDTMTVKKLNIRNVNIKKMKYIIIENNKFVIKN